MRYVRPKKRFGQHYLIDEEVLLQIVNVFTKYQKEEQVLEIGPGMGALTKHLWEPYKENMLLVELDTRCAAFLKDNYPGIENSLIQADFLRLDLNELLKEQTAVIGNFPYNISSQIVFKILDHCEMVPLVVGMFQKEVAARLASGPGNRTYGAISVLAQIKYDIQIEFDIGPEKFDPPPKVVSSVLVMTRKEHQTDDIDLSLFRSIVKSAFGMRRKKLSNALAGLLAGRSLPEDFADKRAEALSVDDYIYLTKWWKPNE